jgi:hypothetical protein
MNASASACATPRPGWREPWVWLVFGIPALTVVAGLATWWFAAQRADSNVAEDWYRQGLTINRSLERDARAAARQLHAELTLLPAHTLEVQLSGQGPMPAQLTLTLVHPVRADADLRHKLIRHPDGLYRVTDTRIVAGRWGLKLEAQDWRIQTRLILLQTQQPASVPAAQP